MVNGAGLLTRMELALGSPVALIMIAQKYGLPSVLVQRETARLVDVAAKRKLSEWNFLGGFMRVV